MKKASSRPFCFTSSFIRYSAMALRQILPWQTKRIFQIFRTAFFIIMYHSILRRSRLAFFRQKGAAGPSGLRQGTSPRRSRSGTSRSSSVGALLMGVINIGMSIMGVDQNYQKVVKDLVLLAAVIFDVVSKKKNR